MRHLIKNPIAFIAATLLFLWTSQPLYAASPKGTNVKVMTLTPQHLKVFKSYVGYIKPLERVTVKSEMSGTVERINFEEGDRVKSGQVLIHVSTEEAVNRKNMTETSYLQALSDYNIQKRLYQKREDTPSGDAEHITISQMRLQHELTRTQYEHALREFETQKKLFQKEMISEDMFESYRTNLKTREIQMRMSELDLKRASIQDMTRLENYQNIVNIRKSELNLATLELEKSKITAPFDGIINLKKVQLGGYIQRGTATLEMMDISQVTVRVSIPEREIVYTKAGKKVAVQLDALPGRRFYGKVKTVGLEADLKTRTFPTEVIIDNPARELLPGMMAKTTMLAVSKRNQVIVPRHAVLEREVGSIVFVERAGYAVRKTVRTGHMVKENIQIVSGLKSGDRLIVVGQDLLSHNESVNVVNANHSLVSK